MIDDRKISDASGRANWLSLVKRLFKFMLDVVAQIISLPIYLWDLAYITLRSKDIERRAVLVISNLINVLETEHDAMSEYRATMCLAGDVLDPDQVELLALLQSVISANRQAAEKAAKAKNSYLTSKKGSRYKRLCELNAFYEFERNALNKRCFEYSAKISKAASDERMVQLRVRLRGLLKTRLLATTVYQDYMQEPDQMLDEVKKNLEHEGPELRGKEKGDDHIGG
jgi:hypothetical protein